MPKPNKLREFLERLREAVPLPTVLGLPVNFRGAIQCPHPNHNDTNASFNIYDHGRGHCFGAGHPGKRTLDVFDLVMLRQQLPFKLAVAEVAATAKIRLPEELINAIPERQESLERRASLTAFHDFFVQVCHQALLGEWPTRALDLIADGGRRRELTEHLQCLREDADKALHAARHHYGFSDDALASWRIGFCPQADFVFDLCLCQLEGDGHAVPTSLEQCFMTSGLFTPDDSAPWLGGRLVFPYGDGPYVAGRAVPGVRPRFLEDAKYLKPLSHTEKNPQVWVEAAQPLLVSPGHSSVIGPVQDRSPLHSSLDVIVAEGLPDAVSAWQAGHPVVSPATTHAAKGDQLEELKRIGEACRRRGSRLVFLFDSESNESGAKGAIETALPLVREGIPVAVATLPMPPGDPTDLPGDSAQKVDLNEWARSRRHAPDCLDEVLRAAVPFSEVLLSHLPADTPLSSLRDAMRCVQMPGGGERGVDCFSVFTPLSWWSRDRNVVLRRFPALKEAPAMLTDLDEEVRSRFFEVVMTSGAKGIPLGERLLYNTLFGLSDNDEGNAEALRLLFGDDLRFDVRSSKWSLWAGHSWQRAHGSEAQRLVTRAVLAREEATVVREFAAVEDAMSRHEKAVCENSGEKPPEPPDHKKRWSFLLRSRDHARLVAAEKRARTLPALEWGTNVQFEPDDYAIACQNGVVDLRSGCLRPGRREENITRAANARLDPAAECPRFQRFLREVFGEDESIVSYVQRALGYSLTGDTSEQVLFLCVGRGANGKSVLVEAVRGVLAQYAATTPFSTFEPRRSEQATNDIAALAGVRFVSASESEQGRTLGEAVVKQLTGSDEVSARFLYQEYFAYRPRFKVWLSMNHLPGIRGTDDGIWRRLHIIPFNVSFKDRADPNLLEKLGRERDGIFRWLVEGALRWQEERLSPPQAVRGATEHYRNELDLVRLFLGERTVADGEGSVAASHLYRLFREWADVNGHRDTPTQNAFGRRLSELGVLRQRRADGNHYVGLKLTTL